MNLRIFCLSLQPNNQNSNKKWTITRRIITIRKVGGQQARPLILLPQNYALCIVNYALNKD